jgi:O-antigen ligase
MKLVNWILFLFCLAWFATFTSQSLVDLVDFLVVITALTVAAKSKEFAQLFKSFAPAKLWLIWIFVVALGLGINVGLSSAKPWQEALEFRWILTFLSLIYLTNIFVKSEEGTRQKILSILSPLVLCMNLAAVVIYFVKSEPRAGGMMNAIMPFSHNLGMLFCFYLFILFNADFKNLRKLDYIHLSIVVSGGLLLIATLTRGVWIGSAGGILLAAFLVNKKLFAKVFAGLVLVSIVVLATQPKIYNRFFGKTESEATSNSERVALWRGNFRIIQDHPIWGVGYQQNKNHLRKYYDEFGYPPGQRISHAHNQYLQNWGGTGTLGLLCYLAFLFFLLKPMIQSLKSQSGLSKYFQLGLISALICFLIGGLTEANFNIAKNRMLFLLIAAWAYSITVQQRCKT